MTEQQWYTGEYGDKPLNNPQTEPSTFDIVGKVRKAVENKSIEMQMSDTKTAIKINNIKTDPLYNFNYNEALRAGYTASELVQHIGSSSKAFDVNEARKYYSDDEILKFMADKAHNKGSEITNAKLDNFITKAAPIGLDKTRGEDFTRGLSKSILGLETLGVTVANKVGLVDDEKTQEMKDKLVQATKHFEDTTVDKDMFSASLAGSVVPDIASLPITNSKTAIFALETVLGTARALGEGENDTEALKSGATNGAIAVAGGMAVEGILNTPKIAKMLMDKLDTRTARKTADYYQAKFNILDSEADDITKEYLKTHESTGKKDVDRLKAIVEHSGKQGVQLKAKATLYNSKIGARFTKDFSDRVREVNNRIVTNENINDVVKVLDDTVSLAKNNFNTLKYSLNAKYGNNLPKIKIDLPKSAIDELDDIKSARLGIKQILEDPNASAGDYLEAMSDINKMIKKTKGTTAKNQWKEVRNSVDKIIQDTIGEDYATYRAVSTNYRLAMEATEDKLGETLLRAVKDVKGKDAFNQTNKSGLTVDEALRAVVNSKTLGVDSFKTVENLIGTKHTAELEKNIIKNLTDAHGDSVNWDIIGKSLENKGFVTEEGKALKEFQLSMQKSLKTEDLERLFVDPDTLAHYTGIGTDFVGRVQSMAITLFLKRIGQFFSKDIRYRKEMAKIWLKNPTKLREAGKIVEEMTPGIKQQTIDMVRKDLTPLLEHYTDRPIRVGTTPPPTPNPRPFGSPTLQRTANKAIAKFFEHNPTNHIKNSDIVDTVMNKLGSKDFIKSFENLSKLMSKSNPELNAKRVNALVEHKVKELHKDLLSLKGANVKVNEDYLRSLVNFVADKILKEVE